MRKKSKLKTLFLGIATLVTGATVSVPALVPSQVFAATEAVEATSSAAASKTDTVTETERKTITWVIYAVYKQDDGSTKPVKSQSGDDYKVTRSATFTRTVIKDKNTGKVISAGDWSNTGVKLADFDVPTIQGYIPDKTHIDGITVYPNSKPKDTIIYYRQDPASKRTMVTESKDVTRNITYYRVNDDGSATQFYSSSRTAHFVRNGYTDGTGKKVMSAWPEHTFKEERVTGLSGYTPDITTIPSVSFTPDNPPKDVNVYFRKNNDYVIDENETKVLDSVVWKVTFTDGQGKVLKTMEVENGKSASAPAAPKRDGYTFAGWDSSFDKVTGNLRINAKWTANQTEWITESKTVKRTISYIYDSGKPVISTEGTPCKTLHSITFRRAKLKDLVTGKIIKVGDWSSKNYVFPSVASLNVQGYTPNITKIASKTVTPNTKSWEEKVVYSKSASKFTGVRYQNGSWRYYKNGKIDTSFTGVAKTTNGNWVFVKNGKFDTSYTGVARTTNGNWVFVKKGRLNTSYTGVAKSTTGNNVFVKNGRFYTKFTGYSKDLSGKRVYVKNGRAV